MLTAASVARLRTFMVNCKFHIWVSLSVSALNGLHQITSVDISTSSRFVDVSALRMDCIYLSQKFGRPLVRWSMPLVVLTTIAYNPFLSPMIRGKRARSFPCSGFDIEH